MSDSSSLAVSSVPTTIQPTPSDENALFDDRDDDRGSVNSAGPSSRPESAASSRPMSRADALMSRPESVAGKSDNGSNSAEKLLNLHIPTQTKKAQKRKHIKTKFDDEDETAMDAQRKEKERLERLEKIRQQNSATDHIAEMEAFFSSSAQSGILPQLDLNNSDFEPDHQVGSDFDILSTLDTIKKFKEEDADNDMLLVKSESNDGQKIEVKPSTSKVEPEVIDLSSDDEDDVYPTRIVPRLSYHPFQSPLLSAGSSTPTRRNRWATAEKDRADYEQMEAQYKKEKERMKRMRQGDIENTETHGGRLLVNAGHPAEDPDVFVAPHLTHILQPHQLGGVRFMFDNVIESLETYRSTPGFGCILAHSMGLGKTIQVITFTEIFIRATKAHKVLIIVPINTIQNWYAEFEKWMPKYSDCGDLIRSFNVRILGDAVKTFDQRVNLIECWHKEGGVLLIGYDMFRLLIRTTQPKKKTRMRLNLNGVSSSTTTANRVDIEKDVKDKENDDQIYTPAGRVKQEAHKLLRECLLDPGPDLVVCDEGHKIKNLNTDIAISLGSIKTSRRIVLTGYPLQNNLMEYYCMVDFVRPKYLGEKKAFMERFERPIKNGQCVDSTHNDVKLARQRTHVLIELVKGFVQRRTHNLLKSILPESREYVLLLRKSNIQRMLYRSFVIYANAELRSGANGNTFNPLKAFAACSKIWNHPDILAIMLQKAQDEKNKKNDQIQQQQQQQMQAQQASQMGFPLQQQNMGYMPPYQQYPNMSSPYGMSPMNNMSFGMPPNSMAPMNQMNTGYPGGQMQQTLNYQNPMDPQMNSQMGHMPTQFPSYQTQSMHGYPQMSGMNSPFGMAPQQQNMMPMMSQNGPNSMQNQQMQMMPPNPMTPQNFGQSINSQPTRDDIWGGIFDSPPCSNSNSMMSTQDSNDGGGVDELSGFSTLGKSSKKKTKPKTLAAALCGGDEFEDADKGIKYDWSDQAMKFYERGNLENGYKLVVTFELLDECTKLNEKMLIFSQNLTVLALLEEYLARRPVATADGSPESWEKNKNYLRFDGSTTGTDREKLINKFNQSNVLRLFLISTRAGSLGINLVSANRCIIFDACWNPCHDAQAVCRVYRYGQQKKTFIYRLITDNCMEKAIFNRQISKHGLQQRVVDDAQVDANITQKELETLLMYDEALDVMHDRWDTKEWNIDDQVLNTVIDKFSHMLSEKPFLHESLILEREEGLSEEEKREAQLLYEMEKRAESGLFENEERFSRVASFPSMSSSFNSPTVGSVLSGGFGRGAPLQPPPRYYNNMTPLPLRSTPMPSSVQMLPPGGASRVAGGSTMSMGTDGNTAHWGNGFGQGRGYGTGPPLRNPTRPMAFPGAAIARPPTINESGYIQSIVTDRPFILPVVGKRGQMRPVPQGTEAILVRPQTGTYLKLDDKTILDAAGTVFDTGSPEEVLQMRRRKEIQRQKTPEVIELE